MELRNTLKKRAVCLLFFVSLICFSLFFCLVSTSVTAVSGDSIIYNFNNAESVSLLTKRYQTVNPITYSNGAIHLELDESKVSGAMDGFGYDIAFGENEFSYEEYPYIRYNFKFTNCFSGALVNTSGTASRFGAQMYLYYGSTQVLVLSYDAGTKDDTLYSVILDLKDWQYYIIDEDSQSTTQLSMNLSSTYKKPYYNLRNDEIKTINKIQLNIMRINNGYTQDLSAECQYFGVFTSLDNALAYDGSVAKIGTESFRFIEDAFNSVESDETIKLTQDVELNELTINEDITLDLNGKSICFNEETIIIGKLTIIDSVGSGSAEFKSEPILSGLDALDYDTDEVDVKIPKKIIYNFNNAESVSLLTKRYQTVNPITYSNGAIHLELDESKVSGAMDGFGYDIAFGENEFSYEEYPYIRYNFKFTNCFSGALVNTSGTASRFGAQIYLYYGSTQVLVLSYDAGTKDDTLYSVILDLKDWQYYIIDEDSQTTTQLSMNLASTYSKPYYNLRNDEIKTINKIQLNIMRINNGYAQDLSAECQYFGVFTSLDNALAYDGSSVVTGDSHYRDLNQAIEGATSGATIVARDNVYVDGSVTIDEGKSITIDIKGKSFVFYDDFVVNGNLKFIDSIGTGTVTFTSQPDVDVQDAMSIKGGTYNIDVSDYLENGYGVKQESGEYEVLPLGINIYGSTISTQGNIGVKFAINKTDVKADLSDASVTVVVKETETVFDLSDITPDAYGYYVVSVEVSAKQMTDEITVKLANNGVTGKTYSYSVQEYAVRKLNDESTDPDLKDFIKAMLNYGAAAQEYFEYNNDEDNLANSVLEETDRTISLDGITHYTDDAFARQLSGEITGLSIYGATVSLNSETAIKLAFRINELDLTKLSFNLEKTENENAIYNVVEENSEYKLELSENNGYNNTVKLSQSGDYYILIIDNIVAKDLNSIQSITIINTDTDESIEIKYGVFSYARDNYNKSSALEQLFDAMLVYNDKAIAWFN